MSELAAVIEIGALVVPIYHTTSYAYDGAGRLLKVTLPTAGGHTPELEYRYDPFGNLAQQIDPLDNVTEYAYDRLHRLTQVIDESPDGVAAHPTTTYTYDAASQLVSVTDPLNRVTRYDYDDLGRMVRAVSPNPTTGAQWNLERDPYDSEGVPFRRYEYDAVGNLVRTLELEEHDIGPTFVGSTYVYDALGRLTKQIDPLEAETKYTYDKVGNLTSLTDPNDNTTSWAYDQLDRLVSETNELGFSRTYVSAPSTTPPSHGRFGQQPPKGQASEQEFEVPVARLFGVLQPLAECDHSLGVGAQ